MIFKQLAKPLIIVLLTVFSFNLIAAEKTKKHNHKNKNSLLPKCQTHNALPSVDCGKAPAAIFNNEGKLYVVFSQNGHIYFTTSADNGKNYTPVVAINPTPELISDGGENRPKIVLGKNQEIFISWTHKTNGRYSGDVRFSRSVDNGKTFQKPITINSNKDIIGHRFEALEVDNKGRIYLVWIDKRDREKAKKLKQSYSGASLYYSVSTDNGKSFEDDKKLIDNSCECCRIAIDKDLNGGVVALWRHIYPVSIRDHALSLITPNMATIKNPPIRASKDNWTIDGCPHHGPDLSIDDKNIAHMAWFTQGKNNKGLMYARFNLKNKQQSFKKNIDKSPSASRPQVYTHNDSVYLMWKKFNGEKLVLYVEVSNDRGKSWLDKKIIATTKNNSDHPDFVANNDKLFASWHSQSEGFRLIPIFK